MAYLTGTLTGTFTAPDGSLREGTAYITPSVPVVRDQDGEVIISGSVSVPLVDGSFSKAVAASNDASLDPTNFAYHVTVVLEGTTTNRVLYRNIILNSGATVDLATVGVLDPAAPSYEELVNESLAAAASAESSKNAAALSETNAATSAAEADADRIAADAARAGAETARDEAMTELGRTRVVLMWDEDAGWPARPQPNQLAEWLDVTGDAPEPDPATLLPGDLYIPAS